ncbi:hypothetical protein GmHk_18G051550 [Glycine max]|nr:hypothetical protein GmHk_18G051550 [Glycine max]
MVEKTKKKLEEAAQSGSTEAVIDPPSPIRRHVKWKMDRTKKIGQMTSEATKEITEKINTLDVLHFFLHGSRRTTTADSINQGLAGGVDHRKNDSTANIQSQFQSQMQSQGLALPPEPEVGPSAARVSTKESCVDPSGNDPDTSDSDKCGLYIEENLPRLVALERVYEGSTTVHNIPLLHDQVKVKVGVEEVKDVDALVPVPIDEVNLVGVST